MGNRLLRRLVEHIHQNIGLYLLIFLSFLTGTIAGAIGAGTLSTSQEGELVNYLNMFLVNINGMELDSSALVQKAVLNNLRDVLLIWFLGLTVIGIPLVLGMLALRGFVLGFTVGFLVQQKTAQGLLLALFSVLPQNLFNIPALVAMGVAAVSFSLWLIRGRRESYSPSMLRQLAAYSLWGGLMAVLITVGGLIEAYLSPLFVRLIAAYFG